MSEFYDEVAETATDLINEVGQPIKLTRTIGDGEYNPETGAVTVTTSEHSGFGVPLDYRQDEIDGSRILQGDRRVYIDPGLGAVPKPGDRLELLDPVTGASTVLLVVVASRPLAPGGQIVLHDVQARGTA